VVQNARRTGQSLGVNGVFGNLGVAAAGLVTGLITGLWGWRAAFILPGVVAILTGILFWRRTDHRGRCGELGAGLAASRSRRAAPCAASGIGPPRPVDAAGVGRTGADDTA
jgi:MFS family permease